VALQDSILAEPWYSTQNFALHLEGSDHPGIVAVLNSWYQISGPTGFFISISQISSP